ncbi:PD-(D/E)XK nuclease family protein [Megasphaera sp.]|uniref:PD-(D/E)XK nuclease family protein n=1 Tax=Megasphaera sp. TaxID=2023260 RepID=UPI00352074B4
MALTVLMGKAGSGKSRQCFREIQACAAGGGKAWLLVPDQATYGAERRLAESMAGRGFLGIEVVGFSRLAYKVFQERGLEHASLSELARKIILQRLLHKGEKDFSILQTAARQPNFAETADRFLGECRSFCVSPEALRKAAEAVPSPTLAHKLEDIARLYEGYQDFLADHFGSADDTMTLLAREVGHYTELQGAHVWVDGFQWFTPQQLEILRQMEKAAAKITITLTLDGSRLQQQRRETALFHRAYEVYRDLKQLFPHLETVNVPEEPAGPLTAFRDGFFQTVPQGRQEPVAALAVWECPDRDGEIDAVARKITALCRQGYRWRDFLVLARTSDLYHDRVERIFRRWGIPCFSDYRRPMTSHPAAEAITALLGVFRSRWSHESLFRLLKTDLFPIGRHDIDDLENYCLAYGIQGRHWLSGSEWTYGRRQDRTDFYDEAEEAHLQRINAIRAKVRDILLPCWQDAQAAHSLREWCTLLYRWLCQLGVPAALRRWQDEEEAEGLTEEGKEHEQVWKRIGSFLNEVVSLCGDDETDLDEFARIVEDGLANLKFSLIPPTLDHVTLTAVERGYTMQAKVVFLCGVNDGIFPQHSSEEGLFSDKERHRLADLGIVLAPGSRFRSFQERFLFYLAATRASERFILSYVVADDDGSALEKASWIHQLCDKGYVTDISRKEVKVRPGEEADYLLSLPAALDYLPSHLRPAADGEPVDDIWWALYDWAWQHGWRSQAVRTVQGLFHTNLPVTLPENLVRRLFASDGTLRGSVTKFEQYRSCPFAYFSRYGLGLEERPRYQFAAPDLGMLVHGALRIIGEKLLREKKQWHDIPDEDVPAVCRQATDELAPQVQHDILMSNAYFAQIKERLIQTLTRTVRRLSAFSAVSDFHMEGLEKAFGRPGSPWEALHFTLKNGLNVVVTGQIDRIDTLRQGDRKYVVIIDYKSGRKQLDISQIFTGLELQLLTYMFVALMNIGGDAIPAAVLYCYVRNDKVSLEYRVSDDDKKKLYDAKSKLTGFYLDDGKVMQELDTSMQGFSEFLNLRLKKDGSLSDSSHSVYSEAGWSHLLDWAARQIQQIAGHIGDGDISIQPLLMGRRAPCTYCPYRPVCRFDTSVRGNTYEVGGREDKEEMIRKIFDQGGDEDDLD